MLARQRSLVSHAWVASLRRTAAGLLLLAPLAAAVVCPPRAQAQATLPVTVLHTFTDNGSDALYPYGALLLASDGNFYGTTALGGTSGQGAVFRINPAGAVTVIYSFTGGADGAVPYDALVQGSDGNFYGTTSGGNSGSQGTVFRLTPAGALTVLYTFPGSNNDGNTTSGGVVLDSQGNLYGTVVGDGNTNFGSVFSLNPTTQEYNTLHTFTGGNDGTGSHASLAAGGDGNFYGTSEGTYGYYGTVFRVNPMTGAVTTVHNFTIDEGTNPTDTLLPSGGFLYGTAAGGGTSENGTVFRFDPATGGVTVLYNFTGGSDGSYPIGGLVLGGDGNFYGTTDYGAASADTGTVFRLTPAGVLTTVHTFNGTSEGDEPNASLVVGSDGNLYGTTSQGMYSVDGTSTGGAVFRVTLYPDFFDGQAALANGVYYLSFPDGNFFGYYSYLADPRYIYHFDLGYEYLFDAEDGKAGVYLYDFASSTFFYTSPVFPFPYLYDFTLNSVLYYYPDPNNPGHYDTDGVRYFYDFATGTIITK